MKKILLLSIGALLYIFTFSQNFDALSFSKTNPAQRGKNLEFKFDKNLSPLRMEKDVAAVVYQFVKGGWIITEPALKRKGNFYTGSFVVDTAATMLGFRFENGEVSDNNKNKGFYLPVTDATGKPVIDYYTVAKSVNSYFGNQFFQVPRDPKLAEILLNNGKTAYPELGERTSYMVHYIDAYLEAKMPGAAERGNTLLRELAAKPGLGENDYAAIALGFNKMQLKAQSDSVTALKQQIYPQGEWRVQDLQKRFSRTKSPTEKLILLDSIFAIIPAGSDQYKEALKSEVAMAYIRDTNSEETARYLATLNPDSRASLYNNISWEMAEQGKDLQRAKEMSFAATMRAKQEMNLPVEKKPATLTSKQWKESRESIYGMYADTYAFILYQLGDYKGGLPYAKFGAESRKLNDAEYNERYAMLLAKAAPAPVATKLIEEMAEKGKASPKTKAALKELYVAREKSDTGFDAYYMALSARAKEKRKIEITKSMISKAAPAFSLKDWEGNEVSLAAMKGKTLVVDFWATWCGPCIASMPGMKAAQEKFAGRDDVKFLFIDTWETVDDKLANSKDFMKQKKYPFYVLMDNENKMVSDFEVSGIPTKFIIDPTGNVRFKSVGFSGNTEELAEEVALMVELAQK